MRNAAIVVERCYGHLKDLRRVATRHDKLARHFFSTVGDAVVLFWL
jgi:hypothetical protein